VGSSAILWRCRYVRRRWGSNEMGRIMLEFRLAVFHGRNYNTTRWMPRVKDRGGSTQYSSACSSRSLLRRPCDQRGYYDRDPSLDEYLLLREPLAFPSYHAVRVCRPRCSSRF
jgi:hypothetical protein